MRHAVITVHLIHEARTAGTEGDGRLPRPPQPDAPADPALASRRLVRWASVASRFGAAARRGRARTSGLRAGSPGGGA